MLIRCPQCEHSRSVNEAKIPPAAELATCPRCGYRFRFRGPANAAEPGEPALSLREQGAPGRSAPGGRDGIAPPSPRPGPEVQRPQGAVRETAAMRGDIWDAVDTLNHRWQAQLDQQVTEVAAPGSAPDSPHGGKMEEESGRESSSAALDKAMAALRAGREGEPLRLGGRTPHSAAESGREAEPARGPAFCLQGADDPGPEERVEQDIRLLREAPEARPVRNLGSLMEYPDIALAPREDESGDSASAEPDEDEDENAVPWENPAAHGWIRAFMGTLHGVMFRGPLFFSRLSAGGSLGPGYLFFLILGYVTILASLLWSQALAVLLPGVAQGLAGRVALPALLLLAPVALGLMLLFVTGCIRVILLLLAPEKSVFPLVYKVVSYSMAPFVLSLVPFVGPVIGTAWFMASLVIGCRNALKLSWELSVFAPLPPAVLLLGGLARYFL